MPVRPASWRSESSCIWRCWRITSPSVGRGLGVNAVATVARPCKHANELSSGHGDDAVHEAALEAIATVGAAVCSGRRVDLAGSGPAPGLLDGRREAVGA